MEQYPLVNKESKERTSRPNLLDVVKINGRLAQVIVGGNHIKFLDDASIQEIDWNQYNFKKYNESKTSKFCVKDLVRDKQISEKEYQTVYWSPEQDKNPKLRDFVTFFGVYTKK